MEIWPVIDLQYGRVVQAIGGNRASYQPIQSPLVHSSDPLHVALSLRTHFDVTTVYVADLDAIEDRESCTHSWMSLVDSGLHSIWLDAGYGSLSQLAALAEFGQETNLFRPVLGLESLTSLELVTTAIQRFGRKSVALSLDLRRGRPICGYAGWSGYSSIEIVDAAFETGIENLIVLDLADVGVSKGVSTLALLEVIRTRYPDLALITGGGIRDIQDLERLSNLGIDAALVATALHQGSLTPQALAKFSHKQR